MLISGVWTVEVFDQWGRVVATQRQENSVMSLVAAQDADLLRAHPRSSPIRAIALGDDGTANTSSLTQLFSEITRKAIPAADVNTAQQQNIRVGSVVTIKQLFGPGLDFTLREAGLFADIIELSNPTVAPVLTPSESGGILTAGTWDVVYTWANNNGETEASPVAQAVIAGSTGKITVEIPALPAQATEARIFIGIGAPTLNGTTTTTDYEATDPSLSADEPPVSNTSLIPGIPNAGAMINRVVFADQAIIASMTCTVTVPLVFNSGV